MYDGLNNRCLESPDDIATSFEQNGSFDTGQSPF